MKKKFAAILCTFALLANVLVLSCICGGKTKYRTDRLYMQLWEQLIV